ncbi:DUF1659 domain-containing protein [Metabacillus iocasae]|uniref:DUF1659 domain-containing protein n=1 Tax=Priestia iocasae TaxID=2291674 RepID=A0ABS2QU08_9BACI|nr:DUF1659 domain-containing protein [Metabacillus iocasae]MBM7702969.1 hypothetical protein [Metabacillus iocasae]
MSTKVKNSSQFRLVFEEGMKEDGSAIFKSKTFNNVRQDATADELQATAEALASLQTMPLEAVEEVVTFRIYK